MFCILSEVSPCTLTKKDQNIFPAFPQILHKQILQSIFCFISITQGKICKEIPTFIIIWNQLKKFIMGLNEIHIR